MLKHTRLSALFWLFHIGVNTFTWFPHFLARKKNERKIRQRTHSPPENNNFIVITLLHFRNELLPYTHKCSSSAYIYINICWFCMWYDFHFSYHTLLHIAPSRLLFAAEWTKFFLVSFFGISTFILIRCRRNDSFPMCINATYTFESFIKSKF